jgi:outer membrane immunogenic protein
MKQFLILPAALVAMAAGPVFAADMPMKAAPAPIIVDSSWTGMYLGGSVGEQWAKNEYNTTCLGLGGVGDCGAAGTAIVFPGFPDSSTANTFNNNGVKYGVYYGAMFQAAQHWVFGVESDFNFFNKTNTVAGIPGCTTTACTGIGLTTSVSGDGVSFKNGDDFSLRARAGFLVIPDLLLYATGGPSWMKVQETAFCTGATSPACTFSLAETHTHTVAGFTVGGGLEWKVAQHFLLRGEYRFSDYGTWKNSFFQGSGSFDVNTSTKITTQTATFGIAYLIPPPRW